MRITFFLRKIISTFISKVFTPIVGMGIVLMSLLRNRMPNKKRPPRLVWGPTPLISNKYWSNALRKKGYHSITLMTGYYKIHNKADYDQYTSELIPQAKFSLIQNYLPLLGPYIAFSYALRRFDIFHHPLTGGFLGDTPWWRLEAYIYKLCGKKTVLQSYGSDAFIYSRISDPCLKHALLLDYPQLAKKEPIIRKKIDYWTIHADILSCVPSDGIGRWDFLAFNSITIDTESWLPKNCYSSFDGRNGIVNILHSPNHRGVKGTEFLVQYVHELQEEGLKIKLILLENIPNVEVKRVMREEADIVVEQFLIGYALNGIEAMASGLPSLCKIDNETYTRVYRRYSYLNECPILSTTPETLKDNLRILITNPSLREELGRAGRKYVEKYHSNETAQYIFESIYDKIWYGKEVDLMNLFHPLKSEYNKRIPLVQHPLVENHLPDSYFKTKK